MHWPSPRLPIAPRLRRGLALLLALLLAPGTTLALALAGTAPGAEAPLLARFADDSAALAAALATAAPLIALPCAGQVVLAVQPGLAEHLRAAGAHSVTRLRGPAGCAPTRPPTRTTT